MGSASTASPTLHTPLCDLLGIRYPIIQAPMAGGFTTPELVAAVVNAGGLGMLAGMGIPPERLRELIRTVRGLTSGPFGVNFLIPAPVEGNRDESIAQRFLDRFRAELGLPPGNPDVAPPPDVLDEQMEAVFDARVPIVSFALGDPDRFVERAHAVGSRVVATVTTVAEAQRVAAGEVDLIVAQGAEAGGHQSSFAPGERGAVPLVGTLALVPQVADAVDVPVVASGGIMDGRGIAAALALGALGAQLGTRFLLAHESGTSPTHRQARIAANETDTIVTRAFTGRAARGIRTASVRSTSVRAPIHWRGRCSAPRRRISMPRRRHAARGNTCHCGRVKGCGWRRGSRARRTSSPSWWPRHARRSSGSLGSHPELVSAISGSPALVALA